MMDDSPITVVLPIHTPELFRKAVAQVVECLKAGEVVALPTETVYGLAANALDAQAVGRIYEIKGRPAHNPIIVHVSDVAMARACARVWPETASQLAASFWPGPLTMVLPKSTQIPEIVVAGGDTVGLRCPGHPFMRAVIHSCGFPLAAPSANVSNAVSPTEPGHVLQSLKGRVSLVVDGGQSQVGIESTVLDLTVTPVRILRPGMIHASALAASIGAVDRGEFVPGGTLRSPGLLSRHYSPRARLMILEWTQDLDLHDQLASLGIPLDRIHIIAHTVIPSLPEVGRISVIPHDAEAYARAIYGEFHLCDQAGAELIVLEKVPDSEEWEGIADRLERASN